MILDIADQLCSATALPTTASTTAAVGIAYIDRLASIDDGKGESLIVYVRIGTATVAGTASVQFILQGNPTDPTFASGTITQTMLSDVILAATLVVGYELKVKVARAANVRYLRLATTNGAGTLTGGATVDCYITNDDVQDNVSYPAGYTVS